jgi:hypothetical protein
LKIGLASESFCQVIDTSSCIGKRKLGQCSKGHLEVMAYEFLVRSEAFCILFGLGSGTGCDVQLQLVHVTFGHMLRTLSTSHMDLNTLFVS